jgi:hypothetical protein
MRRINWAFSAIGLGAGLTTLLATLFAIAIFPLWETLYGTLILLAGLGCGVVLMTFGAWQYGRVVRAEA